MIEVKDLCAGYNGKAVLKHLSATFPEGRVTAVLGPNGCGKTTLLKALCGILPAQGQIQLDGADLTGLSPRDRAKRMAYLSQNRTVPDLTVDYLVLCGRYPHAGYRYTKADEEAARSAMEAVGILDLADRPLTQLSGGQRQKAYVAMALAQDTPVILLDEPTTYLDIGHQLQLLRQLQALAGAGKTVVAVLHDLPAALGHADHILLMDGGEAIVQGTPEEIFTSGMLSKVFGVSVHRFTVDGKPRYYCENE